MKNKIIDVTNLTKKYSSKDSLALDHVNLSIEQGSIFKSMLSNASEPLFPYFFVRPLTSIILFFISLNYSYIKIYT